VTAVATAKATWYSDIPLYSNTTQTCWALITLPDIQYTKITRQH
jgi:hypothetical protein